MRPIFVEQINMQYWTFITYVRMHTHTYTHLQTNTIFTQSKHKDKHDTCAWIPNTVLRFVSLRHFQENQQGCTKLFVTTARFLGTCYGMLGIQGYRGY
jgi:hypothetical protein